MSKQKKILVVATSLLGVMLIVAMGYAFSKRNIQNKNIRTGVSQTNGFEEMKRKICLTPANPVDDIIENPLFLELLIKDSSSSEKDKADILGYYFCEGFLKDNVAEACRNSASFNQCQSSFNFNKMILASLNGEKEKAQEICKNSFGDVELCEYIGELQEIKEKDICAKAPEKEKAFCYAFFSGDTKFCADTISPESCKQSANFLNILEGQDEGKCDTIVPQTQLDNADVICRIRLSKDKDICVNYKYRKFMQSFCELKN